MKWAVLAIVPFLILGGVVAAAFFSFIEIPGITPSHFGKPVEASTNPSGGLAWTLVNQLAALDSEAKRTATAKPVQPATASKPEAPEVDPDAGDTKLAKIWNDLEPGTLTKMTEKWQPAALAKILSKMDGDQVTKYLTAIAPDRADSICRAIQTLASEKQSAKGA